MPANEVEKKLKTWHVLLGILAILATGGWFLTGQWSELTRSVAANRMAATSNKKTIMEFELQRICEKYHRNWPCTTAGMADHDKARYEQYKKWHEDEKERLDKQMGG